MAFADLDVAGQRLHLPQLICRYSNAQLSPAQDEETHASHHCIKIQHAMGLPEAWQLPIGGKSDRLLCGDTTTEAGHMCGRLSQYHGIHDFVDALSMPYPLGNSVGDQPLDRYNVAPTTRVALLRLEDGVLHAELVRWGWRPHWAKDRAAPINARVEKVAHGPFFRAIWPHRAIVPIDNWFEWVDEGGQKKQPYLIRRRDGRPSLCAGIGQFSEEPNEHDGFVIITADSVGGMVDVHDRRPVVLAPDLAREWMNPATPKEQAEQMALNLGELAEVFEWFRVNTAVGNVRNQGAELIRPV